MVQQTRQATYKNLILFVGISLQKSICYILTIAFVTRVATVDQNSPLWQPAMGSKTHNHGVQEKLKLLQGMGSLLRHQISAIHNKKALFPSLQRALIEGL